MYKEIAFDPQCLKEYHYYGILKSAFGAEKGRFIVAALNEWVAEAFAIVKNSEIQDVKKKSVKNYLNSLRKNKGADLLVLPFYRKSVADATTVADWYGWFVNQREYMDFDAIVSERDIVGAVNYEEIIGDCEGWNVPPTVRVDRSPAAIVAVLIPILRFGTCVTIIDQFFKLAGNNVLHELLRYLSDVKNIKKLTIVTSIDTAGPDRVFDIEYRANYIYLPKVDLVVAPARFFHDRYLITDNSAVKAGHGFSDAPKAGAHADRLSLSLCGKNEKNETEADLLSAIDREIARVIELNP